MTDTAHDETAREGTALETVTKLLRDARIAMLTTMTDDGRHVSRPMGLQEVEFDGDLWFFTEETSHKVAEVRQRPQVNVAVSDQKHSAWVSISGTAEVVHDRARAEELWNPFLKAWFPDGVETPGLTLIKVRADSAEYWDSPSAKVVQLVGLVKAAVTGQRPDVGRNEAVDLDQSHHP